MFSYKERIIAVSKGLPHSQPICKGCSFTSRKSTFEASPWPPIATQNTWQRSFKCLQHTCCNRTAQVFFLWS